MGARARPATSKVVGTLLNVTRSVVGCVHLQPDGYADLGELAATGSNQ